MSYDQRWSEMKLRHNCSSPATKRREREQSDDLGFVGEMMERRRREGDVLVAGEGRAGRRSGSVWFHRWLRMVVIILRDEGGEVTGVNGGFFSDGFAGEEDASDAAAKLERQNEEGSEVWMLMTADVNGERRTSRLRDAINEENKRGELGVFVQRF
ncbi:hypothetical protein HAX54_039950 [Datura stramonium]|uniref:Uncharacterized protein n=1 Tax=Datura stramonium TaxID=4076 RepID=A0ABS8SJN1_DATST|nr:hypothetical protein [Datura stramonium]